jgi:predicted peptidase
MSAGGDPNKMDRIKHMPLWTFHGDMDKAVSVNGMRATVEALKQHGRMLFIPSLLTAGMSSGNLCLKIDYLQDWLFSKTK